MLFFLQSESVEAVDLGGTDMDFSLWGMFMQADPVVKAVMILLILASFWSWAIIFEKIMRLRRVFRDADHFEDMFWSGQTLENLFDRLSKSPGHPMAAVFVAAMREWKRTLKNRAQLNTVTLQERVARTMRVTITREMERLERQAGFLATVGSTAPFVGLFGTVWGIMNSFQSIALTSNTSLAVVAPGIAEALAATALGLVAAIPAVMAYNKITADLGRFAGRLEGFGDEFMSIMSRQLEDKKKD